MINQAGVLHLPTLLGDYPNTRALKSGQIRSASVALDFADVKVPNTAFKDVVRHFKYDVAELAIVTYLQAKAHGKPLVLLPAVIVGTSPHPFLVYNAERGRLAPAQLAGNRVGIRAYSVTTAAWIRGVLQNDHGVDLDSIKMGDFRRSPCRRICRSAHRVARGCRQVDRPNAHRRRDRRRCGRRCRSHRYALAAGDRQSQ